ncbi:hypothetical protein SDC9_184813 [bioreactor metagenome]|uniref:Uncharacterized protein n=1 Tax=bioreactor metagenome TaxID=1076179 RepID=A0A645HE36_9ZZZZ
MVDIGYSAVGYDAAHVFKVFPVRHHHNGSPAQRRTGQQDLALTIVTSVDILNPQGCIVPVHNPVAQEFAFRNAMPAQVGQKDAEALPQPETQDLAEIPFPAGREAVTAD